MIGATEASSGDEKSWNLGSEETSEATSEATEATADDENHGILGLRLPLRLPRLPKF